MTAIMKLFKILSWVVVLLLLACGAGFATMTPQWRALVISMPTNTDVLFWSQRQREVAFRMFDQMTFLIPVRQIEAGGLVSPLGEGKPLTLPIDTDAYMRAQNHAALIVLHKDDIRLEKYGLDFDRYGQWTNFSVAKSFTSTLVGAAIQDGYIESLNDRVTKYIPELVGSAYDDVSIEHLLTMTSGVAWNEDYEDPTSDVALFKDHSPSEEECQTVSYMKGLPRKHTPGTVWNYSTGETSLIGVLVSKATGKTLSQYLGEKVWQPMGAEADATWLLDKSMNEHSGCCLQARTRDILRYGRFMLNAGQAGNERVLPREWLVYATRTQIASGDPNYGYGYQWWTHDDGSFEARGIFGQGIFIDPTRELVVVVNSNWTTAEGHKDGEAERLRRFYRLVQLAVDEEADQEKGGFATASSL